MALRSCIAIIFALVVFAALPALAEGIKVTDAAARLDLEFRPVNVTTIARPLGYLFIGVADASWQCVTARPLPCATPKPLSKLFVGTSDAAMAVELRAAPFVRSEAK